MTSQAELDAKLNLIVRTAILRLLENHALCVQQVIEHLGEHLSESDVCALDDYMAGAHRLVKALGAGAL